MNENINDFLCATLERVKHPKEKLYRGMPIKKFDKIMSKITDVGSLHYQICYMYYIDRKSELEIAHKVSYSIENIKKIKSKINNKKKGFNKSFFLYFFILFLWHI